MSLLLSFLIVFFLFMAVWFFAAVYYIYKTQIIFIEVDQMIQVNFRIPEPTLKQLKQSAKDNECSIEFIINQALKDYLTKPMSVLDQRTGDFVPSFFNKEKSK